MLRGSEEKYWANALKAVQDVVRTKCFHNYRMNHQKTARTERVEKLRSDPVQKFGEHLSFQHRSVSILSYRAAAIKSEMLTLGTGGLPDCHTPTCPNRDAIDSLTLKSRAAMATTATVSRVTLRRLRLRAGEFVFMGPS